MANKKGNPDFKTKIDWTNTQQNYGNIESCKKTYLSSEILKCKGNNLKTILINGSWNWEHTHLTEK